MMYVHKVGSINRKEGEELDVKAMWKAISPAMIRRTDRFIQLSLLGAYEAIGEQTLPSETALYMASGQGNLAVFKRLRDQRYIKKQPPKPVDFINSLSNTSGFYVAQFFGINGKNLNLSSLDFIALKTLLLAQNDLHLKKMPQILLGGVDELQEPTAFTRKTLGICDDRALGEGSNWMLLSNEPKGALASLEVIPEALVFDALIKYLSTLSTDYMISFGLRFSEDQIVKVMAEISLKRHMTEHLCGYYETIPYAILNDFIQGEDKKLVFVDAYADLFRLVKVESLPPF